MCLRSNDKTMEKFLKRNKNKKEIIVWKVYVLDDIDHISYIYPPYRKSTGEIFPGFIVSNRRHKNYDGCDLHYADSVKEVNRGIHVFLNRKDARAFSKTWNCGRVFRCTAKTTDLVAVGGSLSEDLLNEAVFMKIHISKNDFERGKKGRI